jgi:hypothetical protein
LNWFVLTVSAKAFESKAPLAVPPSGCRALPGIRLN